LLGVIMGKLCTQKNFYIDGKVNLNIQVLKKAA
jgi:hypothetical protein